MKPLFLKTPSVKASLPWVISLLAASVLFIASEAGKRNDLHRFDSVRAPMMTITALEAKQHVQTLASDEFMGRETGTPGQWLAAKYIAHQFDKYGLKPAGAAKKFYQNFEIVTRDLHHTQLSANIGEFVYNFSPRRDYSPFGFTGENRVTAPVVFAGYGITAPEYGYDDYADINVRNKIVLVLRHEPQEKDPDSIFDGDELTEHAHFETKARNALRHGASALLLVSDPNNEHKNLSPHAAWPAFFNYTGSDKRRWQLAPDSSLARFPALWISMRTAQRLLQPTGKNLSVLQDMMDTLLQPASFEITGLHLNLEVELAFERRTTQNVIGLLEGSDPALRDEVVVVAGHHDHVGVVDGLIYNGADDNASGIAGLLEIADAFVQTPMKPARSILFIAFSAEELGLLGSEYYVKHPLIPLEKTVAMINLDMISRNDDNDVSVIGSRRSRDLHDINLAANHLIGFDLNYDGERYFNRSDQANFAKHQIPVIFYNTATHPDYHRPTDDVEKINPEKLARVARLAFLVAWKVAESEMRPTYDYPN